MATKKPKKWRLSFSSLFKRKKKRKEKQQNFINSDCNDSQLSLPPAHHEQSSHSRAEHRYLNSKHIPQLSSSPGRRAPVTWYVGDGEESHKIQNIAQEHDENMNNELLEQIMTSGQNIDSFPERDMEQKLENSTVETQNGIIPEECTHKEMVENPKRTGNKNKLHTQTKRNTSLVNDLQMIVTIFTLPFIIFSILGNILKVCEPFFSVFAIRNPQSIKNQLPDDSSHKNPNICGKMSDNTPQDPGAKTESTCRLIRFIISVVLVVSVVIIVRVITCGCTDRSSTNHQNTITVDGKCNKKQFQHVYAPIEDDMQCSEFLPQKSGLKNSWLSWFGFIIMILIAALGIMVLLIMVLILRFGSLEMNRTNTVIDALPKLVLIGTTVILLSFCKICKLLKKLSAILQMLTSLLPNIIIRGKWNRRSRVNRENTTSREHRRICPVRICPVRVKPGEMLMMAFIPIAIPFILYKANRRAVKHRSDNVTNSVTPPAKPKSSSGSSGVASIVMSAIQHSLSGRQGSARHHIRTDLSIRPSHFAIGARSHSGRRIRCKQCVIL